MPRSVDDDIDQFARPGERGDFINNHGNAVAEQRHGKDGATCGQTILPATNSMQQASVGMCDYVGVKVYVDFGCAQHYRVHQRGEVSLAVIVVRSEWRGRHMARIAANRLHPVEIKGLPIENVISQTFLQQFDEKLG